MWLPRSCLLAARTITQSNAYQRRAQADCRLAARTQTLNNAYQRRAQSGLLLPTSISAHGLVGPSSTPTLYARRLPDLPAAGRLLTSPGLLWAAVEHDAAVMRLPPGAYVASAESGAADFFARKALHGRTETMATLTSLMGTKRGQFMLFLGGKDVGKSMMLRSLAATLRLGRKHRVVHVDARETGSNFTKGIVAAIQPDASFLESVMGYVPPVSRPFLAAVVNAVVPGSGTVASAVLGAAAGRPAENRPEPLLSALMDAFVSACSDRGQLPVLIVDEANLALTSVSPEVKQRTLDALQLLTRLTKQDQLANVILAASEHSEQFRLEALGFSTAHITRTVVADEVPPGEMRALLTSWGCGPQLATGLMAVYGGHVWLTYNAFGELARMREAFSAFHGAASPAGVAACMAVVRQEGGGSSLGDADSLEDKLRCLAEFGHCAIDDPLGPHAELLGRHGVGGIIARNATTTGVPPQAWEGRHHYIAVAASQGTRLLLASALAPLGRDEGVVARLA